MNKNQKGNLFSFSKTKKTEIEQEVKEIKTLQSLNLFYDANKIAHRKPT